MADGAQTTTSTLTMDELKALDAAHDRRVARFAGGATFAAISLSSVLLHSHSLGRSLAEGAVAAGGVACGWWFRSTRR
jgi:hypothetical protein